MKLSLTALAVLAATSLSLSGCSDNTSQNATKPKPAQAVQSVSQKSLLPDAKARLNIYTQVTLNTDLSHLSTNQIKMLSILIDVAQIMDELFWLQANGQSKQDVMASIDGEQAKRFALLNYGPWDRLDGDKPFLTNTKNKPLGAGFYPSDITKEELNNAKLKDEKGLYSLVKRDNNNQLITVPYSTIYKEQLTKASALLSKAAKLADDKQFAHYLELRAKALLSDQYQESDFAWMDMKNNKIDMVVGPIETYEDQLFGYRSAFEAYVLIKDLSWSEKLAKYASYLPQLQKDLPVPAQYKQEVPGSDADLNAYDVVYYAGHSNAGSKTIAINLPNDEQVQLEKGTRRLQLKNAMRAKFDKILLPISEQLIVKEQRKHVTFNAFFANTMFHEVAHGLGIKQTINGKGTVRQALQEHASALEEGKADILGLYMVEQLLANGAISEGQLEDYYVTFMAGIFRSVRFGASSAHGKANMVRFNYFADQGAFSLDSQGLYQVDMVKMKQAVASLSELILTLQGNGDYAAVNQLMESDGVIKKDLKHALNRLEKANIPVDVEFAQGKAELGLM